MIATIAAILVWLGLEIFGEAAVEATRVVLRPVTRPTCRAFVMARWPWPLLLGLPLGVAGVVEGFSLLSYPNWSDTGLLLFFGGAGVFLCTLILWYETRGEAAMPPESTRNR